MSFHPQIFNLDEFSTVASDSALVPTNKNMASIKPLASDSEYQSLRSFSSSDITVSAKTIASEESAGSSTTLVNEKYGQMRKQKSIWSRFSDGWHWECSSVILSVTSFLTLLGILGKWDGRPVSEYNMRLTINTFTLIMSLASKALMVLPVAMSAAQLRWIRCRMGSTLYEFHNLEQASRGPLGALISLTTAKTFLAILGPTIILLSLGFEAFTQQSIHIVLPDCVSVLTDLSWYGRNGSGPVDIVQEITQDVGIGLGVFLPPDSSSQSVVDASTGCTTSYLVEAPAYGEESCSQDYCPPSVPYFTLELCSKCWNVSDLLERDCLSSEEGDGCFWALPSGLRAWEDGLLIAMNSSAERLYDNLSPFMETISWFEAITPIQPREEAADCLGEPPSNKTVFRAEACALGFCTTIYSLMESYKAQRKLEEPLVQVPRSNNEDTRALKGSSLVAASGSYSHSILEQVINRDLFRETLVQNVWVEALREMAMILFNGQTNSWNDPAKNLWFRSRAELLAAQLHSSYYQTSSGECSIEPDVVFVPPYQLCDSFQVTLNSFLASVSRYLRYQYGSILSIQDKDSQQGALGKYDPFYKIRWQWLIYPTTLEVASALYLTAVMFLSRKHGLPLWKNSTLATLYHGIDLRAHPEGAAIEGTADMERVAKETRVRLAYTPIGFRLVAMDEEV